MRRRLGQHFLVDRRVAARIVAAAELGDRPSVVEIGPGRGALTNGLRRATDRLYLIELDSGLVTDLEARYRDDPGVVMVAGDILKVDLAQVVEERGAHVVGNLPYGIASQILLRLVEHRDRFPFAVVMLQEEMARRVAAGPGGRDYGVLSLLVQLYAEVRPCFGVPRRAFRPPPCVESRVVRLRLQRQPRVPVADPALFRTIVRGVFQHRRKMLRGTLGGALEAAGLPAGEYGAVLREAGVDATARPESLSLDEFAALTSAAASRA